MDYVSETCEIGIMIVFYVLSIYQFFSGNVDGVSRVTNYFPQPVTARIVRITAESKHGNRWQMRFEIVGNKRNLEDGNNIN